MEIEREFEGVELGDKRLRERCLAVASLVAEGQGQSLPEATGNAAALEGTYRLLRNARVTPEALLAPHQEMTARRAEAASGKLVALHDTSEMKFSGPLLRPGLGLLANGTQGYLAHVALVASLEKGEEDVLGVAHVETLFRDSRKGRRGGRAIGRAGDSEGLRWGRGVEAAEAVLDGLAVVHVQDREGDAYRGLAQLSERGQAFVVRSKYNRRTVAEDGTLEALHTRARQPADVVLHRAVTLQARSPAELKSPKALKGAGAQRPPHQKRVYPARKKRPALLHVTLSRQVVKRPKNETSELPKTLALNVVRVFEPHPPPGQEPVEWLLLTHQPMDSQEQVEAIIDAYLARWLVEELFKALKTGCGYEALQLEGRLSLRNSLALYLPIAWRLLRLRTLARAQHDTLATEVLTPTQITVLRAATRRQLPEQLSVREALLAVAALGGHLKQNGEPGWLTLGRGMRKILERELGFLAAPSVSM